MSDFPPSQITPPVSRITVKADGETISANCTEVDFTGTMAAVNSTGGGAVSIGLGLQELTADPDEPLAGDMWVLRETTRYLSHTLAHIGLGIPRLSYRYYLKYRTSLNTTLSFELT